MWFNYFILVVAIGTVIVLAVLMRQNSSRTNKGLLIFTVSLGSLSILSIISLSAHNSNLSTLLDLAYFFITCTSAGFLILVLEYTKRPHYLDVVNLAVLFLVPFVIQILIWTNAWHGFFWDPNLYKEAPMNTPRVLWSWLIDVYVIGLLIISSGFLLRLFMQGSLPYQRQSGILLTGIQIVIVYIIIGFVSNSYTPDLFTFTTGFTILGLAIGHCYYNIRLFGTAPIPRDLIIDRNPDGIVVIDSQNRIVDINPAAESVVNVPRDKIYGQPADVILSNWEILAQKDIEEKTDFIGTMQVDSAVKYFSVWVSPLLDHRNKSIGRIITWRDITERKELEQSQQRARDEMFVLMQTISGAASESSDLRGFLTNSLYSIVYTFEGRIGFIFLIEPNNGSDFHISAISRHGLSEKNLHDLTSLLEEKDYISKIHQKQDHLLLSERNLEVDDFQIIQSYDIAELLLVPLKFEINIIGIIGLGRTEKKFTNNDINRLKVVADELAAHIVNERQRQLKIALRERKRLVQDLHDSITQRLYGLIMMTEVARIEMKSGFPGKIQPMIEQIEEHARYALKEMRLFLFEITPLDLQSEGLVAVINRRLASVEGRADVDARLITDGDISLSLEKQVALYFIAQEALNNALRHAKAKIVTVRLIERRKRIILEVYDDGIGFSTKKENQDGMGLYNMRERAKQIGAILRISSRPTKGTTIRVITTMDKAISKELPGALDE